MVIGTGIDGWTLLAGLVVPVLALTGAIWSTERLPKQYRLLREASAALANAKDNDVAPAELAELVKVLASDISAARKRGGDMEVASRYWSNWFLLGGLICGVLGAVSVVWTMSTGWLVVSVIGMIFAALAVVGALVSLVDRLVRLNGWGSHRDARATDATPGA